MSSFRIVRLLRTLSSEIYVIWDNDRRIGQLDLHYADGSIHGSLILEADLEDQEQRDLCEQIDDDVVSSYMPSFEREEFVLTIYRGEEVDSFNYPPASEEDEPIP
jgi:hypothetical protein